MRPLGSKIILIFLVIGLFLPAIQTQETYEIEGESVTWQNRYGKLTVTPFISKGLITQEQTAVFESNITHVVDIAFRFPYQLTNTDIWRWANISHPYNVIDYGNVTYNYTFYNIQDSHLIPKPEKVDLGNLNCSYFRRGNASYWTGDEYIYGYWTIGYNSFQWIEQGQSANFYYDDYDAIGSHTEYEFYYDWESIKHLMSYDIYKGQHYYYYKGWSVNKGQNYTYRWQYDTPINQHGKWDLLVKLNEDTIQQALQSGRYLMLDPWYNSDWSYKKQITLNNKLLDGQFRVNLTFRDSGELLHCSEHCQNDFGDVRFVNGAETAEIPYWLEEDTLHSGDWVTVWLNNTDNDTDIYMYYNTTGTTVTTSDGSQVFEYFENWTRDATGDFTLVHSDSKYKRYCYDYQFNATTGARVDGMRMVWRYNTTIWDVGTYGPVFQLFIGDQKSANYDDYVSTARNPDSNSPSGSPLNNGAARDEFAYTVDGERGGTTMTHVFTSPVVSTLFNLQKYNDERLIGNSYWNTTHKNEHWVNLSTAEATAQIPDRNQIHYLTFRLAHYADAGGTHAFAHKWDDVLRVYVKRGTGAPNQWGEQEHYIDWMAIMKHEDPMQNISSVGAEQTETNTPPTQWYEHPSDGATNTEIQPRLYITVNDTDSNNLNVSWWSNSSHFDIDQAWYCFGQNLSLNMQTAPVGGYNITQINTNFTVANMTYYWSVNVSDGENGNTNTTYSFHTGGDVPPLEPLDVEGWRFVSLPKNETIHKNNVYVRNETNNYTWTQAAANLIIVPFIYYYEHVYYSEDYFEAYKGYFMYFYDLDYNLWINGTAGAGGAPASNDFIIHTDDYWLFFPVLCVMCGGFFIYYRRKE